MNKNITDGGPAFPVNDPGGVNSMASGMSLRDWYAGMALQAIIIQSGDFQDGSILKNAASMSYSYANAMLRARGEP